MTTAVIVAWILWMHVPSQADGFYVWVPHMGHETFADCVQDGLARQTTLTPDQRTNRTWYSCFPNGFDPRDVNQKTR